MAGDAQTVGGGPEVGDGSRLDAAGRRHYEVLAGPGHTAGEPVEIGDDERRVRLGQLNDLIGLIRPAVQSDGGDLVLVAADVATGVVEVQLQGACSSCAISATTLKAGVDRILKDRLSWVTEVLGGVDEEMDFETSAAMGRGSYIPS